MRKRTNEELAEAMRYLLYDHEPETPEEIDAFLRSEGLDPEEIADYGRKLAERELAASPLNPRNRGLEKETGGIAMSDDLVPTATEALTKALRELAAVRRVERQAAEQHAKAQANLAATTEAQEVETTKGLLKEAQEASSLAAEAVRWWAIQLYEETDNKQPLPCVCIRVIKKAFYSKEEALAWCKINAPIFLTLDIDKFERAAFDGLPWAPVDITRSPQAIISADLSMYEETE